jgi:hypothetical protein
MTRAEVRYDSGANSGPQHLTHEYLSAKPNLPIPSMSEHSASDILIAPIELAHVRSAITTSLADRVSSPITPQRSTRANSTAQAELSAASKKKTVIVISCVTYGTGISAFLAGIVTIAIPAITKDLHIPSNLVLWYVIDFL